MVTLLAAVSFRVLLAQGCPSNPVEIFAYPSACPIPASVVTAAAESSVVVSFRDYRGRPADCGGVLVPDGFVLTAKHCTPGPSFVQTVQIERNGAIVTGRVPFGRTNFGDLFPSEDLAVVDIGLSGRDALLAAGAREIRVRTTDQFPSVPSAVVLGAGHVVPVTADTFGGQTFEYLANTYPGWSGGGVIGPDGSLIGIHVRPGDSLRVAAKTAIRLSAWTTIGSVDPGQPLIAESAVPVVTSPATQDLLDQRFVRTTLMWPTSARQPQVRREAAVSFGTQVFETIVAGSADASIHTFDIPYTLGDASGRTYMLVLRDPYPSKRGGVSKFEFTVPFGFFSVGYPRIDRFELNYDNGEYTIDVVDPSPAETLRTRPSKRIELCREDDCQSLQAYPFCPAGGPCSVLTGQRPFDSYNLSPDAKHGCNAGTSCFSVRYAPGAAALRPPDLKKDDPWSASNGAVLPLKWFTGWSEVALRVYDENSSFVVVNRVRFFNPAPVASVVSGTCKCHLDNWCSLDVSASGVYDYNRSWQQQPVLGNLGFSSMGPTSVLQTRLSDATGNLTFLTLWFRRQCSGYQCLFGLDTVDWFVDLQENDRLGDPNFRKRVYQTSSPCQRVP
jgi:hypothetical protein